MTGTEDMIEEEVMTMTGADMTITRTEETIMTGMVTAMKEDNSDEPSETF
ncbi:hypothetical protein [Desulfopila sp. IMCC35006]|nr:hypothetical protein [Desulfopila sp. IMCC35006]